MIFQIFLYTSLDSSELAVKLVGVEMRGSLMSTARKSFLFKLRLISQCSQTKTLDFSCLYFDVKRISFALSSFERSCLTPKCNPSGLLLSKLR